MNMIHHHYGAMLIELPLDQLWSDLRASLLAPHGMLGHLDPVDVALADGSAPTFQIAMRSGDTARLQAARGRSAATHTLVYQTSDCTPEIEEYVATCTLQRVVDEPRKTLVEWTRAYRAAAHADGDRSSGLVARLLERDQALVASLAAAYGGAEALLIDYALGGATVERRANQTTSRHTSYVQAA